MTQKEEPPSEYKLYITYDNLGDRINHNFICKIEKSIWLSNMHMFRT